ncbi:glycine cleavage system protein GcvH [Capnocytophaga sputigena]|jgi:glycine cleavage system H protein|uniref:glycine cleavage system protein GcvH n=1 Tax=Capnocytophaga sputigena TaxID=1019 RepID=UPI0028E3E3AC|nr:glycine cleavage system protein GcvH [Capnocytophaga sputigena]
MDYPTELKYTPDHTWVRLEGDIATVGITDFAQQQLSDIVYVEVETIGNTLAKDTIFGTVEAIKTTSDLFMPMSGEVLTFHEALIKKPEMVNTDPYGEGWMIQIKITTPEEWNSLLSASDYQKLINA